MRAEFAQAMVELYREHPEALFLTGDLGYMALEEVERTYGERFINAGVAEQNMVSVAAGLAHEGFVPWVYSIAPFAVLRPYEQIRNDVCLHHHPVKIVGNGGGYGYGIMGATHHTLEDIAVMRCLPNMKVYLPVLATDVGEAVRMMAADRSPNYLRLNLAIPAPGPAAPFAQWRRLKEGRRGVAVAAGPVVGGLFTLSDRTLMDDLEVWSVGILPALTLPEELRARITITRRVITLEEHYGQCGLNEALAALLLQNGAPADIRYRSAFARGYPSGSYGSQRWHQEESGLAGPALESLLRETLYG